MSTIKDVAKYTGLSISTISKYLNGGNVLKENRILIDEAVEKLGYKVNHLARSLKTNKTKTVGILIPSLSSAFFSHIIAVIEETLIQNGYDSVICGFNFDPKLEIRKLRFLLDKNVDGIILIPERLSADDLNSVLKVSGKQIPLILLDRYVNDFECDTVLADNINASYSAVESLITKGHKRIGIIVGPPEISTAYERTIGYKRVYQDYSLPAEEQLIKVGDYSLESGYQLFNELLDTEDPPSAVFVTNYDMMLGAITAANERGIKIPSDISFIGYDNIELSLIINPPINIVVQPMDLMGESAAKILLKRMKGDYSSYPLMLRHKSRLLFEK
ncbi:MAG: HTH-type transcriptional repressor CytR [Firmicutes bacterium ADurb.Bin182]|nr:MAG: HTH-type transcriptional repressor CytR [Firmicutes bacterium ADurb.Bin182]